MKAGTDQPGVPAPLPTYPRALAIRALTGVLSDRRSLEDSLQTLDLENRLSAEDRAWLQEVCAGTLRWKGRLDGLIDSVALRKKPSGWLRKALLVASYQLVAQDRVQPGRVVFETVSEIRRREGDSPARFGNAVLRKIAGHCREYRELEFDSRLELEKAAAWASLPPWLWKRLVEQHGTEWSVQYAKASLERPVLWIRSRDEVPEGGEPGPVPDSYRVTRPGLITERAGFGEGHFFVQDISSQFLVHAISREVKKALLQAEGTGPLRALDLCAAPGGKTAGLAWNGFQVTSTDRPEAGERRFALLEQTVRRVASGKARVITRADMALLPLQDLVWVDAPCSGTGIIRRHPDVRWLRQEGELKALRSVQESLVLEGWDKVRPGGFLAYSVCSVLKEEGPDLLMTTLEASHAPTGPLESRHWLLVPQSEPGGDGFWAALVRKPDTV